MDYAARLRHHPRPERGRRHRGLHRAIGAQDHPICSIEVLLVDGDSDDGTIEEAKRAAAHFGFRDFRVFTNPRRRTSCALNVALPNAQGEIVVRVDARSRVEPHYVRTCVDVLRDRPEVGEVGGAQIATPRSDRPLDVGLARAQRNRLTSRVLPLSPIDGVGRRRACVDGCLSCRRAPRDRRMGRRNSPERRLRAEPAVHRIGTARVVRRAPAVRIPAARRRCRARRGSTSTSVA